MDELDFDLVIIGAGITGLSAALGAYYKNNEKKIAVFGQPYDSHTAKKGEIDNIPGFSKLVGVDLIQQILKQIEDTSITIKHDLVTEVKKEESTFHISNSSGTISSKAIVLATGFPELKYTIKGEKELEYKGVSHCAICDGALYQGRKVAVIGGGNDGARGALFLSRYCRKITLLTSSNSIDCDKRYMQEMTSKEKITLITSAQIQEIVGAMKVESLKYIVDGEAKELSVQGVFIELKDNPDLSFLASLELSVDGNGIIQTDNNNKTNILGLFAAGKVRGLHDYTSILAGDGYKAGIEAMNYLNP